MTTNTRGADAPGVALLPARITGLPRDSVANVSRIVALDKRVLTDRAGKLPKVKVDLLLNGIETVLGRFSPTNG